MKRFLCKALFLFAFLYAGHAHALTSGTTTAGSIPAPGATSYQSFSASAGQGVMLYAYSANYAVNIAVYKPDGTYWGGGTNRFSGTLPASGSYDVELTASTASATGAYSIAYVQGGGAVSNGSLTSGQSYNGTLAVNGLESFQFVGTSGAGVMLHADASYATYLNVYRPDGSLWATGNGRIDDTLPATGTYTVVAYGSTSAVSGSYRLDYVQGGQGVSVGPLTSGQSYDGTLEVNGLESFQFEGTSGKGLMLYADASYATYLNVYKPDGSSLGTGNRRFVDTLPATGAYTVVAYGSTASVSGAFRLDYLQATSSVSEGSLVSASGRSGTLEKNGIESYKFSGVSGNSLTVSSTGSFTRTFRVYRPDGSYWTYGSNSMSKTLPATGEYTFAVIGSTTSITGDYSVSLTTPPAPVAASDPAKVGADTMTCPVGINNTVGNPLNFDVGFKKQTDVDYSADGLTFARIYRSDSTWTDNTVGALWRHNYARTLDVTATTVEITDGTGATTTYTLSGSDWVPDDADTTATFESVTGGYVYTLPDNTVEKYNSSEQLTRIEYVGGGALNLSYNGSGQLTSVTNENGRQLTLTYSGGRVATLVTPDGTFSYGYDANGNLETVTRPDTEVRQYHYENATYVNALTGITDEKGVRFATFNYDANGKAILSEHAGNVEDYTITYNADDTSTTTNPLGKETTYHFTNILGVRKVVQVDGEASTHCVASNRYYNYDDQGRVLSKTDWENNTTRYEYDDRSNIVKVIEAVGSPVERAKTITWNNDFNLPELITEPGKTTDYDYDTYGRMTSMTLTDTATSETRITTYTYHSNTTDGSGNLVLGRLAEVNGPRTDVSDITEFDYDANLNLIKITNALGQETDITARDSAGRPTTIEDANGVQTVLVYDSNGWLESSTRAYGTALAAQTAYDYDENGNLTLVTLPNGVTLEYSYDNAQRLTGIEDALGNTITYTLDAAGNITQEEIRDSSAVLKYTHGQVFDELSRIIESVGASAQTAEYGYDKNSNLTGYTDPNTNATAYAYDALQRLVSSTDALSGVTELDYNARDDLTGVEDERDHVTIYTYNAFGVVTGETSPDRGTISYSVDKAGNITQRTDARSVVTNYTYDALNRLASVSYPSDSSLDVSLTYDLTTGCGTAGVGQLCSVTDASGSTAYEYDLLGRLTEATETRGGLSFTTAYTYDLAGNVLTVTLDSGRVITYTRNANGQVSAVSATVNGSPVTLASSITYLPFGPVNALTYGNALTFSATFDQDYNPTNRSVSGGIYSHTYDTDDAGNIVQIGATTYDYDALNRLDEENPGSAVTYTYDATDNRLTKVSGGTVTTTIASTSNRISSVDAASYTTDVAGNITNDGTNTYSWNAAGNLATVNTSGGVYTYDWQNLRTKKVAGGTTTHYVYGLNGQLYGEYDNSGNLIREYVYLNNEPLAQIDAGSPEVLTYLHADHLGTPRFGTNSAGTQVWAWTGDAFGVGEPTGSVTVNLRMPGQYYDSESGLFYNWNRYYNPAIGRYISADPIGLDGGMNVYNYADVSPLMYSDPTGKVAIAIPAIPAGYVFWGGAIITASACNAIPACRDRVGDTLQSAADGIGQGIDSAVKWCQQVFSNESAEERAKRCDAEWEAAEERCEDLSTLPDRARPPGIWGGSYDRCVRGQVSQDCGGNRVN